MVTIPSDNKSKKNPKPTKKTKSSRKADAIGVTFGAGEPTKTLAASAANNKTPVTKITSSETSIDELRKAATPKPKTDTGGEISIDQLKSAAEKAVPEENTSGVLGPIVNFAEGFNKRLAGLLTLPIEAVDEALRLAGTNILDEPGNATKSVQNAFESMGVDSTPIEGFSADLGANTFDSALALATIWASAPTLLANAAAKSPQLITRIGAEIAKLTTRFPGLTVATEAGATAGATAGERIAGTTGAVVGGLAGGTSIGGVQRAVRFGVRNIPLIVGGATGATVGTAASGPLGGVVGAVAGGKGLQAGTRAITNLGRKGINSLRGPTPDADAPQPILGDVPPGATRSAISENLERQVSKVELEISDIFARLPQDDPEDVGVAVSIGLDDALKRARALESSLYPSKMLRKTASADPLLVAAKRIRNQTSAASSASPEAELARIASKEFSKEVGKKGAKRIVGKMTSGLRLQQFGSDLLQAQRTTLSGPAPNRRLARNLGILKAAVDDTLRQIDPEAVTNAKTVSARLNDLFFKGPLAKVMQRSRVGEQPLAPARTVRALLKQPGGFRQIPLIASEFSVDELEPLIRQAIRAEFRAVAEQGGTKAEKFLKANESALKSFGDEFIDLTKTTNELVRLENIRAGLQKGVMVRFAERDPQVAFQRLFSSKDPAGEANDIITSLEGNADDLLSFQNEFLAHLFRRADLSAANLKSILSQPKTDRLVSTVLSEEQMTRLRNIVNITADIESGKTSVAGVRKPVLGTFMDLLGRFTGAGVGRRIGAITGGATIQQTGTAATFTKQLFRIASGKIPANEVFARAITDPEFEKLMLKDIPQTAKEVKEFRNAVKLFVSTKTAALQFSKGLEEVEDDEEDIEEDQEVLTRPTGRLPTIPDESLR